MLIKVKVKADSKKEEVIQKTADSWSISVKEPAKDNMANERVREILRFYFQTGNIKLISGHKSPSKIFSID